MKPRVLLPTFEFGPLRCGGLHSFVESFVASLKALGVTPVVIMPASGMASDFDAPRQVTSDTFAEVLHTSYDGTEVVLFKNDVLDGPLYPEDPEDLSDASTIAAWEYTWARKIDVFGMVLAKALPTLGGDLLHLQDAFAWRALEAARDAGIPTVFTVHLLHDDIDPFYFAEKVALRLCDRSVAVSQSYLDEHRELFSLGRSLAIPNGIDPDFWSLADVGGTREERRADLLNTMGLAPGRLFVTASRIVAGHKGMDVLADAIASWDDWGDARFLLLGDGEPAAVERFQKLAMAHPGRLAIVPKHQPRSMVRRAFAAADATIIPSRFEPFGLTQVEAMAMGAIPLVSATGGLKDVNRRYSDDAGFGASFPPGDSAALRDCLEEFLQKDARDIEVYRLRAREAAAQRTMKRCAEAYLRQYQELAPKAFGQGGAPC